MPRSHIEFLQTEQAPWTAVAAGVAEILLSADASSGASSRRVKLAAGSSWAAADAGVDAEVYVLTGAVLLDENRFIAGDYSYHTGSERTLKIECVDDAELLLFSEVSNADSLKIERIRSSSTTWGDASDPKVRSAAIRRLLLRPDTPSGERTWLLRLDTDEPYELNGIERHPCVEEMYLIDGDIHMHTGVLTKGAYFWRPPGIAHGPMGSKNGFVALFRAKEGPFETEWTTSDGVIPWNAPYNPI